MSPHLIAMLQALFVTFLWSTSWVFIKIGLKDVPALTFAGLRYLLAALCLVPLILRPAHQVTLRALSQREWVRLGLLGILFISVAQGAQFLALAHLPALTVSLLLNFSSVLVALLGIFFLAEWPSIWQWSGVCLYIGGIVIYFWPISFPAEQIFGLLVAGIGVLANSLSSVLGRHINRESKIPPIIVTTVSMGVGSVVLLGTGIAVQGMPKLSLLNWAIIGWLVVVNTAFAFTMWNRTLQTLSAMESSIINSTMLIQIAILAGIFLQESITEQHLLGMFLVALATLIIQRRRFKKSSVVANSGKIPVAPESEM
jgi:drug/metabolite transporter (DMT)-like permease